MTSFPVAPCCLLLLLTMGCADAWMVPPAAVTTSSARKDPVTICPSTRLYTFHQKHFSDDNEDCSTIQNNNGQTRRQWMNTAAQVAVGPLLIQSTRPAAALAAGEETTIVTGKPRPVVTSPAVCDTTVSVWKEPNRNRLVYILGTAHISKVSAELASQLVRDVHPEAVFVELDLKRVGGVARYAQQARQQEQQEALEQTTVTEKALPAVTTTTSMTYSSPSATVVVPTVSPEATSSLPAYNGNEAASSNNKGFLGAIQQRALNFGANAIGSAVRGMYKNLGDAGFNPGEEFAAAVVEGQKIGAAIVLGDQDVEVTLRRLTQAIAVTDLNKLNDEELQSKLDEIMPGGGAKQMPAMIPTSDKMSQDYKEELTAFVETMKSRENVRAIMAQLREVAPALAQVMLTERDAYMAAGIDTLNQFEAIVAVMGIAHMDGVEENLRQKGWKPVALRCPRY